jgi:hypothetical protein
MGKVDSIETRQESVDSYLRDLHTSMHELTVAISTLTKDPKGVKNV